MLLQPFCLQDFLGAVNECVFFYVLLKVFEKCKCSRNEDKRSESFPVELISSWNEVFYINYSFFVFRVDGALKKFCGYKFLGFQEPFTSFVLDFYNSALNGVYVSFTRLLFCI